MSDKYNINNYNHVKVEKLGGGSVPLQQEAHHNEDKTVKREGYTELNVQEYTDSSSSSSSGSDIGDFGDEDTSGAETDDDTNSSLESTPSSISGSLNSTKLPLETLVGGKRNSDTDSVSSVSTTEILSKDPLFLVLSEFLMDNETGDNFVNVGNSIVTVLSKINSKLGRIADVLEKKHKSSKKGND